MSQFHEVKVPNLLPIVDSIPRELRLYAPLFLQSPDLGALAPPALQDRQGILPRTYEMPEVKEDYCFTSHTLNGCKNYCVIRY